MAHSFEEHPAKSVAGLQARLGYLHSEGQLDVDPGPVTGKRSAQTRDAIKALQKKLGKRANGIANRAFRLEVDRICQEHAGPKPEEPEAPPEEILEENPPVTEPPAPDVDPPVAGQQEAHRPSQVKRELGTAPSQTAVRPTFFFDGTKSPIADAYIYVDSLHTPGFQLEFEFRTDRQGRMLRQERPGFLMDDDEYHLYYSFRPLDRERISRLTEGECDRALAREQIFLKKREGDVPLLRLEARVPEHLPSQDMQILVSGPVTETIGLDFTDGVARVEREVEDTGLSWTLQLAAGTGPVQDLIQEGPLPPLPGPMPRLLPIGLRDRKKKRLAHRAVAFFSAAGEESLFGTDAEGFLFFPERRPGGEVRYALGWVTEAPAPLGGLFGPEALPEACTLRALDGRSLGPETDLSQLSMPAWRKILPRIPLSPLPELVLDGEQLVLELPAEGSDLEELISLSLRLEAEPERLAEAYALCRERSEKRELAERLQRRASLLRKGILAKELAELGPHHDRLFGLEVLFSTLTGNPAAPFREDRLRIWQEQEKKEFPWLDEGQATVGGEARYRTMAELRAAIAEIVGAIDEACPAFGRTGLLREALLPAIEAAVLDARRPGGEASGPFLAGEEEIARALGDVPALWRLAHEQKADFAAREFAENAKGRLWGLKSLGWQRGEDLLALPPGSLSPALFFGPPELRLPPCVFFPLAGQAYTAARRALDAWVRLGALGPRLEPPVISLLLAAAARDGSEALRPSPDEGTLRELLELNPPPKLRASAWCDEVLQGPVGGIKELPDVDLRLVAILLFLKTPFSPIAVVRADFPPREDLFAPPAPHGPGLPPPDGIPALGEALEKRLRPLWRTGDEPEEAVAQIAYALEKRTPTLYGLPTPEVVFDDRAGRLEVRDEKPERVLLGLEFATGILPRALTDLAAGLRHSLELSQPWLVPEEVRKGQGIHPGFLEASASVAQLRSAAWAGTARSQKALVVLGEAVVEGWRRLQTGAGVARGMSLAGLRAGRAGVLARLLDAFRVLRLLPEASERALWGALLDASQHEPERSVVLRRAWRVFSLRAGLAASAPPALPDGRKAEPEVMGAQKKRLKKKKRLSWKDRRKASASSG